MLEKKKNIVKIHNYKFSGDWKKKYIAFLFLRGENEIRRQMHREYIRKK